MKIDPTRTVNELITAVSMAMDIEEGVKLYHSWRVAIVAARLARTLGLSEPRTTFYAGLLHDVGAVGLPYHVTRYLAAVNINTVNEEAGTDPAVIPHPLLSAEIVSSLPGISTAARAVLDHHENWDGHGFPRGLYQGEIDPTALIINAADITDIILRSDPLPGPAAVADALWKTANRRLSPDVAEALIATLEQGMYDELAVSDLTGSFARTRAEIGDIPVERGVDAIGVTLDVLSRVVDNKHPYTIGHSRRVARYSLLIGIAMGLGHEELTLLKWAALIHDVGKLSVPALMLDKPAALSQEEYQLLQYHTSYTFDIVSMITDLRPVAAVASSHHERYDGNGYPLSWAAEDIPFGARIIAVADAFDAMTSHRPYRSTNDVGAACREIERSAGTQFDPAVVKVAVPVLRHLGLVVATSA